MSRKRKATPYPIIDLFAGPGGLGEGFACLMDSRRASVFKSVASIERDNDAHKTLLLRHFFRDFQNSEVPDAYYDYLAGNIEQNELIKKFPRQWQEARTSALKISLASETHDQVSKIIKQRLASQKKWVLVGGPPCQAYSLVGRSRRAGDPTFEDDEKHFLYREYLKIIIDHKPPVFVMENVKGLLSAKVNGEPVIQKIVDDLSNPVKAIKKKDNGLKYKLYSLSEHGEFKEEVDPKSFVIKAEEYGVPQARHRMFIVGVRSDISAKPRLLEKKKSPRIEEIIKDMPKIRSGVSKQKDSVTLWRKVIRSSNSSNWYKSLRTKETKPVRTVLEGCLAQIVSSPEETFSARYTAPKVMRDWYYDGRLKKMNAHESRSHMESDIHRYLFASAYAEAMKISPKLADFPAELLPDHKNVENGRAGEMFSDRFRVQVKGRVSTTITSHISKDGHYFIHYDPLQCRSLTVREAARLQTFPDNYHFEGPRTSQYHQVGNAVPPYLALQIAEIIKDLLDAIPED